MRVNHEAVRAACIVPVAPAAPAFQPTIDELWAEMVAVEQAVGSHEEATGANDPMNYAAVAAPADLPPRHTVLDLAVTAASRAKRLRRSRPAAAAAFAAAEVALYGPWLQPRERAEALHILQDLRDHYASHANAHGVAAIERLLALAAERREIGPHPRHEIRLFLAR